MVPATSSESFESCESALLDARDLDPAHPSPPPAAMGDNSPKAHQPKSPAPPFAIGVALLLVGFIHVRQAAAWHSSIGIMLGLLSLALGALAIVYGLRVQRGTAESTWAMSPRLGKTLAITATLIFLAFMVLRTWVHHKSPDPPLFGKFPDACPSTRLNGCNRVAVHHPHNNSKQPGLLPFTEFTSRRRVAAVVDAFLAGLPRTTVLERETSEAGVVWHARVLTRLWGFADDFIVRASCEAGLHQSTVEMQGMLRIGDGDMDVNYWRNEALLEALHAAQSSKQLPAEESC